ncbi:MAG: hypothetical protein Rhob2KO_48840 [Rhodopirellula baltica]
MHAPPFGLECLKALTECDVKEVVACKGYHSDETLDRLQDKSGMRTCIPEPRNTNSTLTDKIQGREPSYRRNHRWHTWQA